MDIRNRLLEAIDQSEVHLGAVEAGMSGFDPFRRHIDYRKVVAVLSDLTAEQVKTVEQAYKDHEGRTLWEDIGGGGESHHRSDLTFDQLNRIRALLGGTRASTPDTAEEAKAHRLEADAAELHELLYGDLDEPDVERVMTILRRPADANVLLATAYERLYVTSFATDLVKLPMGSQVRARMLVAGQSAAADAFQVGVTRYRIAALNAKIAALGEETYTIGLGTLSAPPGYLADQLRKQRKQLVEDLEGRLEMTGAEAEAQAAAEGADTAAGAAAARNRVARVLGDVNAVAADIGGPDEAVIRAIAAADPGARAAARLRRLDADGKLDAAAVTAALRALRAEAEAEASRRHPGGDEAEIAIEERTLADEYFGRLRAVWDQGAAGQGPRFDELMGRGNETEATLNRALARGSGRTDDVTELVLALSGDRKDLETVKRVLRDKSAADIARLKLEYMVRTLGRSLDFDLFGDAPVRAGEDEHDPFSKYRFQMPGKATGTDRLILEDYLQRPSQEGGLEEVNYLVSRAEREYRYTIDNRGATGWWRDKWGNEARSLLDETITQVRKWHTQYLQLVGWTWPGTLTSPERAHSPEARELLHNIRLARATIRGDRAAYEEATAALRATFELVASLVVQAALTAVLGPVAELAILGEVTEDAAVLARVAAFARDASVGVASTIGANAIVYGSDYSVEMLKRDLIMGYAGTLGGKAAEKLVGPVAAGLAERLGTKCPQEIVELAGTVGSMEAAAAAEGESLTDDLNLQDIMKNHLMGKAAHGVTTVTKKGLSGLSRVGEHPEPVSAGIGLAPEGLATAGPQPAPGEPVPEPVETTVGPPGGGVPGPRAQEGREGPPLTPEGGGGPPPQTPEGGEGPPPRLRGATAEGTGPEFHVEYYPPVAEPSVEAGRLPGLVPESAPPVTSKRAPNEPTSAEPAAERHEGSPHETQETILEEEGPAHELSAEQIASSEQLSVSAGSLDSVEAARQAGVPELVYGDAWVVTLGDFPDLSPHSQPRPIGPAPPVLPTTGRSIGSQRARNTRIGGRLMQDLELRADLRLVQDSLEGSGARIVRRMNQQQIYGDTRVDINRPDLALEIIEAQANDGSRIFIEYDRAPGRRSLDHAERILANDPEAIVILKIVDFESKRRRPRPLCGRLRPGSVTHGTDRRTRCWRAAHP
jgi:hypothetical protein